MEGFLAQLGGQHLNDGLSQAQNIMYDAWDAPTRQRGGTLARKALKVSPLCADAYVLLAEEDGNTVEDARALYVKGVESGALALGKRAFVEPKEIANLAAFLASDEASYITGASIDIDGGMTI